MKEQSPKFFEEGTDTAAVYGLLRDAPYRTRKRVVLLEDSGTKIVIEYKGARYSIETDRLSNVMVTTNSPNGFSGLRHLLHVSFVSEAPVRSLFGGRRWPII
jgi:hypothetical protein